MKYEDFENFYQVVIKGYIDDLIAFDSECNALSINPKARRLIYKYYEKKRIEIRTVYMGDESKPIDRHKTSACMMYAILRTKVFKIDNSNPGLPEPIRLANEYLAFYVAMNIIEQYKRTDMKNGVRVNSNYRLIIPSTAYESQVNQMIGEVENSFVSSICLTLANIKNIQYFDIFSYSTIMFLLETYTDNLMQETPKL